jgi:hypothetical protein
VSKRWAGEITCGGGEINPNVVGNGGSSECSDRGTGIPTSDVKDDESFLNDPAEPVANLAVIEVIVIERLAIDLPLLLEKRLC